MTYGMAKNVQYRLVPVQNPPKIITPKVFKGLLKNVFSIQCIP